MASIEKLVIQLRKKKQEASKLRAQAEAELKKYRSAEKRLASGIVSLEKKIDSEKENVSDISTVLNQKTSQLESVERLVASAEERLAREKEAAESIQQEIEFAENKLNLDHFVGVVIEGSDIGKLKFEYSIKILFQICKS